MLMWRCWQVLLASSQNETGCERILYDSENTTLNDLGCENSSSCFAKKKSCLKVSNESGQSHESRMESSPALDITVSCLPLSRQVTRCPDLSKGPLRVKRGLTVPRGTVPSSSTHVGPWDRSSNCDRPHLSHDTTIR